MLTFVRKTLSGENLGIPSILVGDRIQGHSVALPGEVERSGPTEGNIPEWSYSLDDRKCPRRLAGVRGGGEPGFEISDLPILKLSLENLHMYKM